MNLTQPDSSALQIDYYTDLLCVWAWIAQRRNDEMQQQWGDRVQLNPHFTDIFGDCSGRIAQQWRERGGYEGYADHVQQAAAPYDTAPVNADVWHRVRPTSSFPAHLMIKAAGLCQSRIAADTLALTLRRSFFIEAIDISNWDLLLQIATNAGLDQAALQQEIHSGRAAAALMADYQQARQQQVKGSPSWVMNEGRQILYGNVGYRVLSANIEELLHHPEVEACWC
jgi:predicted DsbA family dithiol-disulfide isomerase